MGIETTILNAAAHIQSCKGVFPSTAIIANNLREQIDFNYRALIHFRYAAAPDSTVIFTDENNAVLGKLDFAGPYGPAFAAKTSYQPLSKEI